MTSRLSIITMILVAALALSSPSLSAGPDATGTAASATAAAVPAGAATWHWKAVAADGRVHTLPAGLDDHEWIRVGRGDSVEPLSLFRTGGGGQATLTRLDDVILVDPKSELLLPDISPRTRIHQRSGSARYEVGSRRDGRFEVITPYLLADARGTVFHVTVHDGFSAVSVVAGRVAVRSPGGGEVHELFAGDIALADADDGTLDVQREAAADGLHGRSSWQVRRVRKDAERLAQRAAAEGTGHADGLHEAQAPTDGGSDRPVDSARERVVDP